MYWNFHLKHRNIFSAIVANLLYARISILLFCVIWRQIDAFEFFRTFLWKWNSFRLFKSLFQ